MKKPRKSNRPYGVIPRSGIKPAKQVPLNNTRPRLRAGCFGYAVVPQGQRQATLFSAGPTEIFAMNTPENSAAENILDTITTIDLHRLLASIKNHQQEESAEVLPRLQP
jgi:hypothetical protein